MVARKQLTELGLEYDEATFLDRVQNSDAVAVDLFLKSGMNPNLSTRFELERGERLEFATPLMIAAWKGDHALAERLLAAGAEPGTIADNDVSALACAVVKNHESIVELLLKQGLTQESKDHALKLALRENNEEAAQLLERAGADPRMAARLRNQRLQRTAMADLRSMGTAVEEHSIDHNRYPEASSVGELAQSVSPMYIRRLPTVDPWGNPYEIRSTSDAYSLRCLGQDGKPTEPRYGATEDPDADIIFENGSFTQWPVEVRK